MAVRATTAAAVVLLQVLAHHRAVGCVKEHARFSPPRSSSLPSVAVAALTD